MDEFVPTYVCGLKDVRASYRQDTALRWRRYRPEPACEPSRSSFFDEASDTRPNKAWQGTRCATRQVPHTPELTTVMGTENGFGVLLTANQHPDSRNLCYESPRSPDQVSTNHRPDTHSDSQPLRLTDSWVRGVVMGSMSTTPTSPLGPGQASSIGKPPALLNFASSPGIRSHPPGPGPWQPPMPVLVRYAVVGQALPPVVWLSPSSPLLWLTLPMGALSSSPTTGAPMTEHRPRAMVARNARTPEKALTWPLPLAPLVPAPWSPVPVPRSS
ncbi:hypothetical protein B0T10DRAFT_453910 [Thelonectria olida]|uniref:Uncharacterized protein n=1 Tax=Thelonectria olida TaxID=1576542 RepID=A0A9P8WFL6_9HYPO|nr:hypothetical protein B0T10DRAFT_453910 [Thelonectria olida]